MLLATDRNNLPILPTPEAETPPLLVLKFGGSVLRGLDDLPRVAGEIYRQRRRGFDVVAVVSALYGETDRLLAEAEAVGSGRLYAGTADLVSLGEARTAALLRIACDRIGLVAASCQPEEIGLRTSGPETGARPVALDPRVLRGKLARSGLVIVPGFVGVGDDGERTLLERGGSDFSAIYLAGELGAAAVRLYKDVDGVFEADPNRNPAARRYDEVSWADALEVARPLIQPQAVEYAAAKRLPIEVEAIGGANATRVGERTDVSRPVSADTRVRVAIAGFGVVGQAIARRLASEPRFEIVSVLARELTKQRDHVPPVPLTADRTALVECRPDVLVDALSCTATSHELSAAMRRCGVHVFTASRSVVGELIDSDDRAIDEWNCLQLQHDDAGFTTCVGRGAGGALMAEAIVADLYDFASAVGARERAHAAVHGEGA